MLDKLDRMNIMTGAEPFLLKGGSRGVLLVHGFTGSPAEMRLLGHYLHARDYTVLGVRLAGHGTSVSDLEQTDWRHWYGSAVDGWHTLHGLCSEISVVGLSMGGLLSLKLAATFPVARVAVLSTPVFLANRRVSLLPLYRLFRRYVPKKQRNYEVDPKYWIGYTQTPLSSLSSLLELIASVESDLQQITCPTLLIQSRREHTVRPESAVFLHERIAATHKELFWLEKSGHVVTLDIERETVFAKVAEFFAQVNAENFKED